MSENEMKIPKIKLSNMIKHFCTITRHRLLVCKHCFKLGLYWQGLTHDLSKYSPCQYNPILKQCLHTNRRCLVMVQKCFTILTSFIFGIFISFSDISKSSLTQKNSQLNIVKFFSLPIVPELFLPLNTYFLRHKRFDTALNL